MKKLLLLGVLFYTVSCTNPEDRATGDPDSTSFNSSGSEKNFNTPAEEGSRGTIGPADSISPTLERENSTGTSGTNRAYSRDSTK